jgi:Leucine-rich repeat (LRR) protein
MLNVKVVKKLKIRSIPGNMGKFFPKLEVLNWTRGDLDSLVLKDLSQFPHLKDLQLSYNNIKVLPDNVFSNTPDLEFLAIDNNRIFKMDNIFSNLKKLIIMYITENPCTRSLPSTCSNNINEIKKNLKKHCTDNRRSGEVDEIESSTVTDDTKAAHENDNATLHDDYGEYDQENEDGYEYETKYEINVVKRPLSDKTCMKKYEKIGKAANRETKVKGSKQQSSEDENDNDEIEEEDEPTPTKPPKPIRGSKSKKPKMKGKKQKIVTEEPDIEDDDD